MRRPLLLVLLLIAFLGIASAEWVERLRVQAVDNYMNPISGIVVNVAYQKQATDSLDGNARGITDGNGIFETVLRNSVSRYGGGENKVYTITVTNPFGLNGETRKVNYGDNPIDGAHLEQFQYNTTSARVEMTVIDQKGKPVPNATVSISDTISDLTDAKGAVRFGLPLRSYTATIKRDGFTATLSFELESNAQLSATLLIYENRLKVIATNEYGAPLSAVNLTFNGIELETNSSGEAEFSNLRVSKGTLKGIFNGIERSADIEFLDETITKTLVFPSTPLIIDKIAISALDPYEQNCTLLVSCRARDERVALSKISVSLIYSKNGEQWDSITQKNELGMFEFLIPCTAPLQFSYTLKAWNDYGSAQTPIYNWTIPAPVVCQVNETTDCRTPENCTGTKTCSSAGTWGDCIDEPGDGCPAIIPSDCGNGMCGEGENEKNCPKDCKNKGGGGLFNFVLPEGMGFATVAMVLVGSLALLGVLGVLLLTQRDKVAGIYEGLKNWFSSVRHVDKVIERADKEYEREKLSQKYMKDGNTDEFFGLDKEDKGKPPEKPPTGPVKP